MRLSPQAHFGVAVQGAIWSHLWSGGVKVWSSLLPFFVSNGPLSQFEPHFLT